MSDAIRFFRILYGRCTEDDGSIILVDSSRKFPSAVYKPEYIEAAAEFASEQVNGFIRVNLFDVGAMKDRRDNKRESNPRAQVTGSLDEVRTVVAVALDVDANKAKYASREEALAAIGWLPVQPSMVVNSNGDDGGFHVYWVLANPVRLSTPEIRDRVSEVAARYQNLLKSLLDGRLDSTSGIERLLRPVGCTRTGGGVVSIHSIDETRLYSIDELDEALPANCSGRGVEMVKEKSVGRVDSPIRNFLLSKEISVSDILSASGYSGSKDGMEWTRDASQTKTRTLMIATELEIPGVNVFSTGDPNFEVESSGQFFSIESVFVRLCVPGADWLLASRFVAERGSGFSPGHDVGDLRFRVENFAKGLRPENVFAVVPDLSGMVPIPEVRVKHTKAEKSKYDVGVIRVMRPPLDSLDAVVAMCVRAIGLGYSMDEVRESLAGHPLVSAVDEAFWAEARVEYQKRTLSKAQAPERSKQEEAEARKAEVERGKQAIRSAGVTLVSGDPTEDHIAAITKLMNSADDIFVWNGTVGAVNELLGHYVPMTAGVDLCAALHRHGMKFARVTQNGVVHAIIPWDLCSVWLKNPENYRGIPVMKTFTPVPTLSLDWEVPVPGKNPNGTYYIGEEIDLVSPVGGRYEHIDRVLSGFCFSEPRIGVANTVAAMLAPLLREHWKDSGKPAFVFAGNQAGLGKSLLACIVGHICGNRDPSHILEHRNEDKLEKAVATAFASGRKVLLFDNVKSKIESEFIEKGITAQTMSIRKLGGNTYIECDNDMLWLFTANTPSLGEDMMTRCVAIELQFTDDPRTRTFEFDPLRFARENRHKILGELLHMTLKWVESGGTRGSGDSRFPTWKGITQGILDLAGYDGLEENQDRIAVEMSDFCKQNLDAVDVIVSRMLPGRYYSCADLTGFLGMENQRGTDRANQTFIGTLLSRFATANLPISKKYLHRHPKKTIPTDLRNRDGALYSVTDSPGAPPSQLANDVSALL